MAQEYKKSTLRILKILCPWLGGIFFLFLSLKIAHADSYLGDGWDKYLQGVKTFASTSKSGEELAIEFVRNAVQIARNIIGGVALIMGILYGLRLVISRGQEEVIKKQQTNFLYLLLGFMILIIAENVAQIFNPEISSTTQLIDFNATRDQLRDIVSYVKWLLGSICILLLVVSALRLIASQGEEEEITRQKSNIVWSFLGMLTVLLASNLVNMVYEIKSTNETVAAAPEVGITEISSIIRLILVFLGPIAIAFTIYAGFLYLTAFNNEENTKKGKEMIIAGLVAIVMIYGAYAIVNTVTSAGLGFLPLYLA